MDELTIAGIDADMVYTVVGTEEYKIARKKLVHRNIFGGCALIGRGARNRGCYILINVGGEAGAVETVRGAAAVYIRGAEELLCVIQNRLTGAGCRRCVGGTKCGGLINRSAAVDGDIVGGNEALLTVDIRFVPTARNANEFNLLTVCKRAEDFAVSARERTEVYAGAALHCAHAEGKFSIRNPVYIGAADICGLTVDCDLIPVGTVADHGNLGAVGQGADGCAARGGAHVQAAGSGLTGIQCGCGGNRKRCSDCTGQCNFQESLGRIHERTSCESSGDVNYLADSARSSQIEAISIAFQRFDFSVLLTMRSRARRPGAVCCS